MGGCKSVPERPPTPTVPSPGPPSDAPHTGDKKTLKPISAPVVLPTYEDLYPDKVATQKRPKRPEPRASSPVPSPVNPSVPNRRSQEPQSMFGSVSLPRPRPIRSPRSGEMPITLGTDPDPVIHVTGGFEAFLYEQLQNQQRRHGVVLPEGVNIGVDFVVYNEICRMRAHLRSVRRSWLEDLDEVFLNGDITLDAYLRFLRMEHSSHSWRLP